MQKTDLLTKEVFEAKRINQNFATRENRIQYYNQKANGLRRELAYINKPLHTNFKILSELLKDKGEITLSKEFLLGRGFSFCVHTHYEIIDNKSRFAIYHFVIIQLENDNIKIIKL